MSLCVCLWKSTYIVRLFAFFGAFHTHPSRISSHPKKSGRKIPAFRGCQWAGKLLGVLSRNVRSRRGGDEMLLLPDGPIQHPRIACVQFGCVELLPARAEERLLFVVIRRRKRRKPASHRLRSRSQGVSTARDLRRRQRRASAAGRLLGRPVVVALRGEGLPLRA